MNRNDINSRLRTRSIKGKPYVEVNQRILAFWELFPNGAIVTELLNDDGKRCDMKASVYVDDRLVSTGHAFEYQSAGLVNKTSYIENCETSAIGRALGIFGIGITDSIASAEEVESAISHQERNEEPPNQAEGKPADKPDVKAAKQKLWKVIQRFAELSGADAKAILTEELARDTYRETTAYMVKLAAEYEQKMEGLDEHQPSSD